MFKLHRALLLISALAALAGCFGSYLENATLTGTDETIDSAGNIVQTAHWKYPDGDTTTTTQTIPPTAANERRRGPQNPPAQIHFLTAP